MKFFLFFFVSILSTIKASVHQHFFQPITDLLAALKTSRSCPSLSDDAFIRLGVSRVISQAKSGRDFLQQHAEDGGGRVQVSHFFETLNSERRHAVCAEANQLLCSVVGLQCADPFASIKELKDFDIYAGDGHYIRAAAHDERIDGDKQPVGNFYILNLRSRAIQHFELSLSDKATERKHEHDMRVIKRQGLEALRFGAGKGRKVIIVWDKAGIDFDHWQKAKEKGVYFVSREKENMRLQTIKLLPFEKSSACNEGVLSDELVVSSQGFILRRIVYHDVVGGNNYTYLTTNLKLPPGLIALLYKRRWDIEKVFDETENRFQEMKAWATSPTAKRIQSELICITYNLLLLVEERLDTVENIRNQPEIDRGTKRQANLKARLEAKKQKLPFVYRVINRMTQRGVKLIRWLRNNLYGDTPWNDALAMLTIAYTRL
jgi:hypothetical protein